MKIRSIPIQIINEYIVDSPAPKNLNYLYNFGSLLGLNLVILIITGITLAMHYTPHVDLAFSSVEHIMRDVNNGWLIRYIHANTAGLFFINVYIHIGRGLYLNSYKTPRELLWIVGVLIYLVMMATAFLGYVLPFGQMSLWGAIVITNLIGVINQELVYFIWGFYSVTNATLNRFFSLHYLLPFIIAALVVVHLIALHKDASNNPDGLSSESDRIRFHPYYTSKDLVGFLVWFGILFLLVFYSPNYLGHPDNNIPANPLVTPLHIQPEFYYLAFYAILRAIPNKTLGVVAMFSAILILLILPFSSKKTIRSNRYKPLLKILFYIFILNFIFLTILGAKPIEQPFIILSQICTFIYFSYFILLFLFF